MDWKSIPGFNYEASDAGEIRNAATKKIIKPYTDALQEYKRISYRDENGHKRKIMVHTLVASAFLGEKPQGYVIDHINTDIYDNRPSNLRYVTPEENRNNPYTKYNQLSAKIRRAVVAGRISEAEMEKMVRVMKAMLN